MAQTIEIGYICGKGSNHVDLHGVDEGVCGSKAIGKLYMVFEPEVTDEQALEIYNGFVEEQNDYQQAWRNLDEYV